MKDDKKFWKELTKPYVPIDIEAERKKWKEEKKDLEKMNAFCGIVIEKLEEEKKELADALKTIEKFRQDNLDVIIRYEQKEKDLMVSVDNVIVNFDKGCRTNIAIVGNGHLLRAIRKMRFDVVSLFKKDVKGE